MRTALIVSGAIDLFVFMSFPLAPPRLAPAGIIDMIQRYDAGYEGVARPSGLTNRYAAMPSFHFGWDLLCGLCLAWTTKPRMFRGLAICLPLVMGLAIVATGNHYIVDGVAGGALALLGLALGELHERLRGRRTDGVQGAR